jgi:SAM-dependent methyltransferase
MMWSDFLTNQQLPIHKWAHYFPVYEEALQRYRNRSCTLLEIGCNKGGSLHLWKRHLGPYAQIIGLDINPDSKQAESEQIHVRIGSQSDSDVLAGLVESFAPFDIVIDDGSHVMSDINTSFRHLFDHVSMDGVYIVEDLHTAYWDEFEGGMGQDNSFIEFSKSVIDAMHARYIRGAQCCDDFTMNVAKQTRSLRISDSIIVYEKGRDVRKYAPNLGQVSPAENCLGELSFDPQSIA